MHCTSTPDHHRTRLCLTKVPSTYSQWIIQVLDCFNRFSCELYKHNLFGGYRLHKSLHIRCRSFVRLLVMTRPCLGCCVHCEWIRGTCKWGPSVVKAEAMIRLNNEIQVRYHSSYLSPLKLNCVCTWFLMNARSVKDFIISLSCPFLHFPPWLVYILTRWVQSLPVVLNESVVDKGISCRGAFFLCRRCPVLMMIAYWINLDPDYA